MGADVDRFVGTGDLEGTDVGEGLAEGVNLDEFDESGREGTFGQVPAGSISPICTSSSSSSSIIIQISASFASGLDEASRVVGFEDLLELSGGKVRGAENTSGDELLCELPSEDEAWGVFEDSLVSIGGRLSELRSSTKHTESFKDATGESLDLAVDSLWELA